MCIYTCVYMFMYLAYSWRSVRVCVCACTHTVIATKDRAQYLFNAEKNLNVLGLALAKLKCVSD